MNKNRQLLTGLFLLLFFGTIHAQVLVPPDLAPGDTYHLAMLTSTARNAGSTDITVYNSFVQTVANNAGLDMVYNQPVTWKVIGSTPSTNATSNIGAITGPIYNLAGELVATDKVNMFDGSIGRTINIDENGTESPGSGEQLVFTGSTQDGVGFGGQELGGSSTLARVGDNKFISSFWISVKGVSNALEFQYYAVSSALVVPDFCDSKSRTDDVAIDSTEEACGTLEVGPNISVNAPSHLGAYAGQSVRLKNGVRVESGALFSANTCGLDLCSTGAAPTASCAPCVEQICSIDPSCCQTEWDQGCIDRLFQNCGLVCP